MSANRNQMRHNTIKRPQKWDSLNNATTENINTDEISNDSR